MSFHIIHIIDSMGIGGAQSMMFELYHAINKYYPKYKQRVIYTDDRRKDPLFVSSSGVPCEKVKDNKMLIQKIGKGKNTVIIYHKLASSNFNILEKIKHKTHAPVIAINHTLFNTVAWRNFKKLDRMIAVSEHMNRKMDGWYPKLKHSCIHNGVCGYRYDKIRSRDRGKDDIFLTGRINRICGWKHSNEWLKWCQKVKLPKMMVHEYIGAGVGSRRQHNRVIVKKGRNKVKMMGGVNDFATKVSIIKSWDIFLYETNKDEGVSMAILEAMACGVPVICSNHYGNKEIIKEGINGYIFKNKNKAKDILTELINNPKKLKKLKATTKEYFDENLDAKYMAKKYIEVVCKIRGKSAPQKIEKIKEKPKEIKVKEKVKAGLKKKIISASKKNDKFTILTSSYNKAKYLQEWADSILKQKYRPLEVVLANDQSTDNTSEVIKVIKEKFEKNNIELKIINNPKRLYCGGSYYNLVEYISGSYIGVLDADDALEDGAIEYIVDLYKKNPNIYWIYTQFLWCDENMKNGRKGLNSSPAKGSSLLSLGDRGIHGIGSGWRTFSSRIARPDKLFGRHLTCAVDKNMGYRMEEAGPGLFVKKMCYKHRGHPIGSKDSVSSTKHAMNMWKQVIKEAHTRRKKYNKKIHSIIEYKK